MSHSIPKKIHAIWIGDVLGEQGKKNLTAWKKTNKSFQVNLWIDSSLYTDNVKLKEFNELKEWAKENKIVLYNIASSKNDKYVQGRADIYENMPSKQYYNDEINGKYRNLAAASDILRAEVLYQEGGIYIDAEDVFPGNKNSQLSKALKNSDYGFYFHLEDRGNKCYLSNDLIASVPGGAFISAYREKIKSNYIKLYQDERKLYAHRNVKFSNQNMFSGADARKQSTLKISGPVALLTSINTTLTKIANFMPDTNKKLPSALNLVFDRQYYSLPDKQASSWYDPDVAYKYEKVKPIFRSYIREYFNDQIKNKIKELESKSIDGNENKINLLIEFQRSLNALSTSASLIHIQSIMEKKFNTNEKKELGDIFVIFKNCSFSSEKMIRYCQQDNVEAKVVSEMLIKMSGTTPKAKKLLNDLVNKALNAKNGQPDITELNKLGIPLHDRAKSTKSIPQNTTAAIFSTLHISPDTVHLNVKMSQSALSQQEKSKESTKNQPKVQNTIAKEKDVASSKEDKDNRPHSYFRQNSI